MVRIVRRAGSVRFHYKWWGLIFVLPVVTFFAAFNLFPTLFGLWLSFTDYDLLNPPAWVGLDNFANLLADRLFLQAFGNTLFSYWVRRCLSGCCRCWRPWCSTR